MQVNQLVDETVRGNCIKCWTEVYEQQSDVGPRLFQVVQRRLEGEVVGVIGGAVCPMGKLMGV